MKKVEYLNKIKLNFPISFKESSLLDNSWDFNVVILDQQTVFRFPKKEANIKRLKDEIELLDFLKKIIDANIPNYTYIPKDTSFAGCNFIKGEKITKEYLSQITAKEKKEIYSHIALFISQLHKTNYKKLKIDLPLIETQQEIFNLKKEVNKLLSNKLAENELQVIKDIIEEYRIVFQEPYEKKLIHSDLHSEHLLWNKESSRLGVLDFTNFRIDDPAREFFKILDTYDKDFMEKVLSKYENPIDRNFLKRINIYSKLKPIKHMIWSLQGHPLNFEEWYLIFKKTL